MKLRVAHLLVLMVVACEAKVVVRDPPSSPASTGFDDDSGDSNGSDGGTTTGSSTGRTTGKTTTTGTTSTGGATTGSTTAGATTGTTSGEPTTFCTPGATRPCSWYPAEYIGIGRCTAGFETCKPDGSAYQYCTGGQGPQPELCGNQIDDDCNGETDEEIDADGDGFSVCDGDCCDTPGACSATPALVNPGAFEVIANKVDDDCNLASPDDLAVTCDPTVLATTPTAADLAHAFDLCQHTVERPPLTKDRTWGIVEAAIVAADGSSSSTKKPLPIQYAALANYGTHVSPQHGATFAALASAAARDEGDNGFVDPEGGVWSHNSDLPYAYSLAHNGKLQTTPNCTSASDIHDSANLRLRIRVPTNAQSLSFRFKFYSSEYPEFVCTKYNDFFLALLTTNAAGIPADTNISFDANKNPVSVNNAFFDVCYNCAAGTTELQGTGIAGSNLRDGGGTRWLTTEAPVVPGEIITLQLMVWDTGDNEYGSIVILDDFEWGLLPAQVGTHPEDGR